MTHVLDAGAPVSDWITIEHGCVRRDMKRYGSHVIQLASATVTAVLERKIAKASQKENADVSMLDVPAPPHSSATLLAAMEKKMEQMLNAALKGKGKANPGAASANRSRSGTAVQEKKKPSDSKDLSADKPSSNLCKRPATEKAEEPQRR